MINSLFILLFFLPAVVYGQLSINYDDIINLPVAAYSDSNATDQRLNFDIDGTAPVDYIEISESHPFHIVGVYISGENIFTTDGYITSVQIDSAIFRLKIVRPSCCCLDFKEISVFSYDKSAGKQLIEIYKVHQDLLLPISDVVFSFKRREITKDSLILYQAPFLADIRKTDECTGEQVYGNKIGGYDKVNTLYVLYENGEWVLCAVEVEASELGKKHWVLGWVNQFPED